MKIIQDNDLNKPHHQVEFTDLELYLLITGVQELRINSTGTGVSEGDISSMVKLESGLSALLNNYHKRKELRANFRDVMLKRAW